MLSFPIKRIHKEGPVKFRGTPEHRGLLSGRTHWHVRGCQGTGRRHQRALDTGRGHQKEDKSGEATNHLPVFHRAKVVVMVSPSFPVAQRSHKMVGSISHLAKQTPIPWIHMQQRDKYQPYLVPGKRGPCP